MTAVEWAIHSIARHAEVVLPRIVVIRLPKMSRLRMEGTSMNASTRHPKTVRPSPENLKVRRREHSIPAAKESVGVFPILVTHGAELDSRY